MSAITFTKPRVNILDIVSKRDCLERRIAQIFHDNIGKPVFKGEIDTRLELGHCFDGLIRNGFDFGGKTHTEIIQAAVDGGKDGGWAPGDVHRALKLFNAKMKKYGLCRSNRRCNPDYVWNPITVEEYNQLNEVGGSDAARNIFKTETARDQFCESKKNKCEICGAEKGNVKLMVDHWRAHSVYNIDDEGIAVLLCETCNNVHHNIDASKLIVKYKDNSSVIANWVKIEDRVRKSGFMPNEKDISEQYVNIHIVNENQKKIGMPLTSEFWHGFDKPKLKVKEC